MIFSSFSKQLSFSVTIHTIATKSDSDSNLTRKSIESRESEHSVQSKSLLSPDRAKKARKNRRRDEQITIPQSSMITSNKLNNHVSPVNNRYLSKETRFFGEVRNDLIKNFRFIS
jgi:hypothetical protein